MLRVYNFLRLLSLDVVVGAVILSLFLGRYLSVKIPAIVLVGLAASVWLIYVVDHLVDARRIKHKPNTYRHRFHQKYAKPLTWVAGIVFVGLCYLLFNIPEDVMIASIMLGIGLGIYFLTIWFAKLIVPKEIIVSFIYAMGVYLAPFSLNGYQIDIFGGLLFINLAVLAFLNLFLFSFFDMDKDKLDGQSSIPLRLGERKSIDIFQLVCFLTLLYDLEMIFIFRDDYQKMVIVMVFILMLLVLICLFSFKSFFGQKEKFRIMGDAMFYLPAVLLI